MKGTMRILQVCPKPPRPLIDGGCIAMNAITEGLLNAGHSVKVLAMSTEKHPFNKAVIDDEYLRKTGYSDISISTGLNPAKALKSLFRGSSYNLDRFYSIDVEKELGGILKQEKFDLVILESLYTSDYIKCVRENSEAKILLRAHNVEHHIWEGLAGEEKSALKKWYLQKLSKQLKSSEIEALNKVDGVVTITQVDLDLFKKLGSEVPMHVSPFGMEFGEYKSLKTVDHVFHFGSMDWKPNVQGVKWLMEEVWPRVRKSIPEAKLILAGRNMPVHIVSNADLGIEVIGEVASAEEFLRRDGIMTVPILSGSGMRVKAVEGMASGKPLVGTTLGVCGLDLVDGEHGFISDTPELFAKRLILLLESPSQAIALGEKGAQFIRSKFSNELIIKELEKFIFSYIAS